MFDSFKKNKLETECSQLITSNIGLQDKVNDINLEIADAKEELAHFKCELDRLHAEYRESEDGYNKKIHALAIKCSDETARFEHVFHEGLEKKKTELAKLDAQIAQRKEMEAEIARNNKFNEDVWKRLIDAKDKELKYIVSMKDAEIDRMTKLITELTRRVGAPLKDATVAIKR